MLLVFLLLTLSATALYIYAYGFVFSKALLFCLGSFLAVHIIYLGFWWIVSLFIDTAKPLEKQNSLCRIACFQISDLALSYCMVRVHVKGLEKLPKNERFLLVSNHLSLFDPLVFFRTLGEYNISFVSKPSNMALPLLGKLGYGAGSLSIDRENNRNALKTVLQAADYIKRGICSMAVFPEGTRNRTDEPLLPFRAGSFKIAQRADAPLAIACLKNTAAVRKNMFRRVTDTYIEILEVIPAETVKSTGTKELAEYSKKIIKDCLGQ